MHKSADNNLIIATQHRRSFLFGGEAVRFYIINALHPLWVKTPNALYPLLRDEELTIVMPDKRGTYRINFISGDENVAFTYFVA